MRKALLLVALLLLAGGPVYAQYGEPRDFIHGGGYGSHSYQQWKAAIRGQIMAMETWSNLEWRRRATVGRYVRWTGTIVIGSALVYTALDYFYNQLRRQTGTPLDDWYFWPSWPGFRWTDDGSKAWLSNQADVNRYLLRRCGFTRRPYVEYVSQRADGWMYKAGVYAVDSMMSYRVTYGYGYPSRSAAMAAAKAAAESLFIDYMIGACGPSWRDSDRPPLPQWLEQRPSAAQALRDQVIPRYLDDTPLGSPAAPYPGVRLEPVPNPNQWTDNPFTRPDIDTDGDGWPDWVEWYEANRRGVPWPDVINNPQVYPDPYGDPDGDGFPTWEEVAAGTNPYDPASRPQRRPSPATRIDTDGDGWPDEDEIRLGTDPRDPNSKPEGTPPEPEQTPEDAWPGGPPPGDLRPVELPTRQAEGKKSLPEFRDSIWHSFEENVRQRWQDALGNLRDVAADRFPFGLVMAYRFNTSLGSSPCAFTVPVGQYQAEMDICSTPIWQAATTFRPILGALVWVTAVLLLIRRGLDVQK